MWWSNPTESIALPHEHRELVRITIQIDLIQWDTVSVEEYLAPHAA